jgi:hypothetical protein
LPAHLLGLGEHGAEVRVVELGESGGEPLELPIFVRDLLLELLGGRDRLPGDPGQPIVY